MTDSDKRIDLTEVEPGIMPKDSKRQPFFAPGGVILLLIAVALLAFQTWSGNRAIEAERRAEAIPTGQDPLCLRAIDKAACEAHWRVKAAQGGRDPLELLHPVPQPQR